MGLITDWIIAKWIDKHLSEMSWDTRYKLAQTLVGPMWVKRQNEFYITREDVEEMRKDIMAHDFTASK